MRWDNITVVYGVLFYGHKWVQFEAQGPAGPEGFKLNPRVPRVKYGNIIPPQLLSPPYSIQFYYIRSQFRAVNTKQLVVILNVC